MNDALRQGVFCAMLMLSGTRAAEEPKEAGLPAKMSGFADKGEFRDFAAAEQGAMAVQSVVVAFQNAKQLDEQRSKTLQARVDALYNTVENEDSFSSSRFVAALKDVRAAAP